MWYTILVILARFPLPDIISLFAVDRNAPRELQVWPPRQLEAIGTLGQTKVPSPDRIPHMVVLGPIAASGDAFAYIGYRIALFFRDTRDIRSERTCQRRVLFVVMGISTTFEQIIHSFRHVIRTRHGVEFAHNLVGYHMMYPVLI